MAMLLKTESFLLFVNDVVCDSLTSQIEIILNPKSFLCILKSYSPSNFFSGYLCSSIVSSSLSFDLRQLFPVSSAEMAEPATKKKTSMMPDWSQLPEELLPIVSENLENCFDVIHARSVCSLWRSTFPFPCSLLRPSYSLPSFTAFPYKSKGSCTLKKIPLFLFRVRPTLDASAAGDSPSESYFYGGIGRDESEDHLEMIPSPIQCSVKVKMGESEPTLMNMLDCQIIPLGHQYRMIGCDSEEWGTKNYGGVAFLPQRGGEFIVLLNLSKHLLVLRSAEMKWMRVKKIPCRFRKDVVAFRGRFYASFSHKNIVVIDPYSLEVTRLMMHLQSLPSQSSLIPCGNDELFLVEKILFGPTGGESEFRRVISRVSRLDEEAGKWVVVSDLGGRVLFINHRHLGNVSCSANDLPDGCGVSGNSVLFNFRLGDERFFFKYGVHTGFDEDDLSFWRSSRENPVTILSKSPVVALRVKL